MNTDNILPYADLSDVELMSATLTQNAVTDLELELIERLDRANMRIAEMTE